MVIRDRLRAAGTSIHGQIARRRWIARRYLPLIGAISKLLPDTKNKRRVVNAIRTASWPSLTLHASHVLVAGDVELRIVPHTGEFDFDALFFRALDYERAVFEMLRPRLHAYDAVLEIGANVGIYTSFFSKLLMAMTPTRPVFAFEPSREAFVRLQENLRINGARNVQAFNCAVSSAMGVVEFFEPQGHLTNGALCRAFAERFSDHVERSLVVAVDGTFIERLLEPYQRVLLKIDVEGAEGVVLRALEHLIADKRPDIVLELLADNADDLRALQFLQGRYRCLKITDAGLKEKPELEPDNRFRDYLLVPTLPLPRDQFVQNEFASP